MGKKGLSVNTKEPRGRALMKKLVDSADVFVENCRPGALEKLGHGYAELAETNPGGLVYCSISASQYLSAYRSESSIESAARSDRRLD
ncbi:crotonobetainyl-CoA:carnitine CoA-transferase CaiB-like acyl-CoA transferase [Variovorax sp. 1133]